MARTASAGTAGRRLAGEPLTAELIVYPSLIEMGHAPGGLPVFQQRD